MAPMGGRLRRNAGRSKSDCQQPKGKNSLGEGGGGGGGGGMVYRRWQDSRSQGAGVLAGKYDVDPADRHKRIPGSRHAGQSPAAVTTPAATTGATVTTQVSARCADHSSPKPDHQTYRRQRLLSPTPAQHDADHLMCSLPSYGHMMRRSGRVDPGFDYRDPLPGAKDGRAEVFYGIAGVTPPGDIRQLWACQRGAAAGAANLYPNISQQGV